MADTNQAPAVQINVTFGVQIAGLSPISDQSAVPVDAQVQLQPSIPLGDGKTSTQVEFVPADVDQPTFLMIKPLKIGQNPITNDDLNKKVVLQYATDKDGTNKVKLTGTNVFANGMAQLVQSAGQPLKSLWFWNALAPGVQLPQGADWTVTVQIVAVYPSKPKTS